MPRGWLAPRTGIAVRNYLLNHPESSIYEVWKALKKHFESLGYRPPTYTGMIGLFGVLKRLGLIKCVGKEPSKRKEYFYKAKFIVVPEKTNAWEWENPLLAYYNPNKFWRTRTTKRPIASYEELPKDEMLNSRNMREKLERARRIKQRRAQ